MFGYASQQGVYGIPGFKNRRVLKGMTRSDLDSHKTLYAGPDPADPTRVLIRKLLRVSPSTYAYEETRITKNETEGKEPTVHTQVYRIKGFNLDEHLTPAEAMIRGAYRPVGTPLGFSLFYKHNEYVKSGYFTLVENQLYKPGQTWEEWWVDF